MRRRSNDTIQSSRIRLRDRRTGCDVREVQVYSSQQVETPTKETPGGSRSAQRTHGRLGLLPPQTPVPSPPSRSHAYAPPLVAAEPSPWRMLPRLGSGLVSRVVYDSLYLIAARKQRKCQVDSSGTGKYRSTGTPITIDDNFDDNRADMKRHATAQTYRFSSRNACKYGTLQH